MAGAIAWTAPVIIDSLASPAGARSPTKCYRDKLTNNSRCTPLPFNTGCATPSRTGTVVNSSTGQALSDLNLSISSGDCTGAVTIALTDTSCHFLSGTRHCDSGAGCSK